MSAIQQDEAVAQAKRLESLFERQMITEGSLVSGIAELVSPENLDGVLDSLSPAARDMIRNWAKSLPDENCEIIYWPLKREVRLAVKAWLHGQGV